MLHLLCSKICNYFVDAQIIEASKKDLYYYGLQQCIMMLLNIATTLFIGYIFDMVWQSIIYLLAYIPIRTSAGGFHAKTPLGCYCFSVVLVSAVLLVIKYVPWTYLICWIGIIINSYIIILLAPIEDKNKPFTPAEEKVFKKRTRILLFLELFICALVCLLSNITILTCILMSLLTLAVMLILGKIKNSYIENERKIL